MSMIYNKRVIIRFRREQGAVFGVMIQGMYESEVRHMPISLFSDAGTPVDHLCQERYLITS